MKKHTIYISTNIVTGKSYVGYHSTNNPNDRYLGSGRILRRSVKKHGRNNFKKEILEFCNKANWQKRETFWINEKNTKFPSGYNLTDGGDGGKGKIISEKSRQLMSKTRKERNLAKGKNNGMFGNNHSLESRKRMGKTKKENGVGKGKTNSQFDHTIYKFKNTKTNQVFEGYKFDLANKIGSLSCHLNAVVNGSRKHHKNWILI